MKNENNILVICAHPDDETLGVGGTIIKNVKKGAKVNILIFTDGEFARKQNKKSSVKRKEACLRACSILGVNSVDFLDYEDQKLDSIPVVSLAKDIERKIEELQSHTLYTHYYADLNQDHRKLFEATLIAARPTPSTIVKKIICYEIPSSTEYGNTESKFSPNFFVDIESSLRKKILALKQYKKEILPYPHPRSIKGVKKLAEFRGISVGKKFAESFIIIRDILD